MHGDTKTRGSRYFHFLVNTFDNQGSVVEFCLQWGWKGGTYKLFGYLEIFEKFYQISLGSIF